MEARFEKWSQKPGYKMFPDSNIEVKIFDGTIMTASYNTIPKSDPRLPPHTHIHGQIAMFYSGEGVCVVGDKTYDIRKNSIVYIPPNEPHTVYATTEDLVGIDFFVPTRPEYVDRYNRYVEALQDGASGGDA